MNLTDDLEVWLADQRRHVDETLTTLLDRHPALQPSLDAAIRHALLLGGKRLRPALTVAASEAVGGPAGPARMAGAAVELIHTYSLVHDDLPAMDDDDLRRGQPTVHVRWDDATAVLTGDALLTLAFDVLSGAPELGEVPAELRLAMVQSLARAAGLQGMVGGQALDIAATGTGDALDSDALARIHRAKTGALIRASVQLGLLAAGNRDAVAARALDDYAAALGLAFQIVDDILDETADTETLGKPAGSDQALGKLTYVRLLGLDGARDQAAELCAEAERALAPLPEARRLEQLIGWVRDRSH